MQVNYAQPMKIKGGEKGFSHQPVWADADRYLEELEAEQELDEHEKQQQAKAKSTAEGGEGGEAAPAAAP